MAMETLKRYKSSGTDKIPAELVKAGGWTIRFEIHKLINSISNKDNFSDERNTRLFYPVYKKGDKTGCSDYRGISF
jgi:hypothetical protein